MLKLKYIAVVLLGAAPALLLADPKPDNKDNRPATQPHDRIGPRNLFPGGDHMKPGDLNPEELAAAEAFFKESSPRRWKLYEGMTAKDQKIVQKQAVARWRNMEWLKKDDKEIYQVKLDQITAEDHIVGMVVDGKSAKSTDAEKDQIKAEVMKLVELRLKERALHLERIAKLLQAEQEKYSTEQKRLDDDKAREDQVVKDYLKDTLDGKLNWLRPPPPRHQGGGPDKGPRPQEVPASVHPDATTQE